MAGHGSPVVADENPHASEYNQYHPIKKSHNEILEQNNLEMLEHPEAKATPKGRAILGHVGPCWTQKMVHRLALSHLVW